MSYITAKQAVLATLVVVFAANIAACAKPQMAPPPVEAPMVRKG